MSEFYFNDMWRMDWGLGNPNKTAALIAMLMVGVWGLAFIKRVGFWLALVAFTGLGICLVHTFSRGGIVALFFGMLPVAWMGWQYGITKSKVIGLVITAWVMIGAAVGFQAHERYTQGMIKEDRSISNRLDIWEMAPQMIRDAPGGWGIGNSGHAYQEWYQSLDRTEGYRTLVNSHLTWLVELGWWGRAGYLLAWSTVLLLCWPGTKTRWFAVPLGIWLCLGIAAIFSSVAESQWLWILPLAALLVVLFYRFKIRIWPGNVAKFLPPCMAGVGLAIVVLWPSPPTNFLIEYDSGLVHLGTKASQGYICYDKELFGKQPGRMIRKTLSDEEVKGWAMLTEFADISEISGKRILLGGDITPEQLDAIRPYILRFAQITVVNPAFYPRQLLGEEYDQKSASTIEVWFGEFYHQGPRSAWQQFFPGRIQTLTGTGKYLPQWTELIHPLPQEK